MPRLYQKYIGHDNNRDGYMINQIESRVVTRVVRDWEPQVIYNHHQSSPFPTRIWIPPFAEPISPNVHPLMWRTVNLMGMAMSQALEERGQKGAVHMGSGFDNWYPGFMDHAHNFHNVASFLTETALYRYATPHFYTIGDFPPGNPRPEAAVPVREPLGGWDGGGLATQWTTCSPHRFPSSTWPPSTAPTSSSTGIRRRATWWPSTARARPTRSLSRRTSVTPSRPRRCSGASPSTASACTSCRNAAHARRHHPCGRQLGNPHGPAQRQLRAPALRRCRSIRTFASTRRVPRSNPTTCPAGRCPISSACGS